MGKRLRHNGAALCDVQFSWRAEQRALLYYLFVFLPAVNVIIRSPVIPSIRIFALNAPPSLVIVNTLRGSVGCRAEAPRLLSKGALLPSIRTRLAKTPTV